jgi:hypothetical protein
LKSVKAITEGKASDFNSIRTIRKFSEKQTDGSHESGEKMIQSIRQLQPNSPINFVFALETGDIGYQISLKFPVRKHNVI